MDLTGLKSQPQSYEISSFVFLCGPLTSMTCAWPLSAQRSAFARGKLTSSITNRINCFCWYALRKSAEYFTPNKVSGVT